MSKDTKKSKETSNIDWDKMFKEIRSFDKKFTEESEYNKFISAFYVQNGMNAMLNKLLTDKTLYFMSDTKKKLYKELNEGIPAMISLYIDLKYMQEEDKAG